MRGFTGVFDIQGCLLPIVWLKAKMATKNRRAWEMSENATVSFATRGNVLAFHGVEQHDGGCRNTAQGIHECEANSFHDGVLCYLGEYIRMVGKARPAGQHFKQSIQRRGV